MAKRLKENDPEIYYRIASRYRNRILEAIRIEWECFPASCNLLQILTEATLKGYHEILQLLLFLPLTHFEPADQNSSRSGS